MPYGKCGKMRLKSQFRCRPRCSRRLEGSDACRLLSPINVETSIHCCTCPTIQLMGVFNFRTRFQKNSNLEFFKKRWVARVLFWSIPISSVVLSVFSVGVFILSTVYLLIMMLISRYHKAVSKRLRSMSSQWRWEMMKSTKKRSVGRLEEPILSEPGMGKN